MPSITRPLYQHYATKCLSQANIFCVLVYFLVFSIPFYLSFSTQNFWLRPTTQFVPVTYSFTGEYIAMITYSNSTGSGTIYQSNIGSLEMPAISPIVSLTLWGLSHTGSNTVIEATIDAKGNKIQKVELLLFFHTTVSQLNAQFYTSSILEFTDLNGDIRAVVSLDDNNQNPLSAISNSNNKMNLPPYLQNFIYVSDYLAIKRNIYSNNYMLNTKIISLAKQKATTNNIYINVVGKPMSKITYYPGFLQTLKQAFSQYVSLWLIAYLLGRAFLRILARNQVFPLQKLNTQIKFIK